MLVNGGRPSACLDPLRVCGGLAFFVLSVRLRLFQIERLEVVLEHSEEPCLASSPLQEFQPGPRCYFEGSFLRPTTQKRGDHHCRSEIDVFPDVFMWRQGLGLAPV